VHPIKSQYYQLNTFLPHGVSCTIYINDLPESILHSLIKLFANDLPESILHSLIKLFADNCIIYKAIRASEDAEKLQEDLCALQESTERWLMRLNVSKCLTMNVLHPRRNKIITHYKLHNHLLSSVQHYKYLGIIIQNDL